MRRSRSRSRALFSRGSCICLCLPLDGQDPSARSAKETDIDMRFKDVYIAECSVVHASDGAAVVHQLPHVVAALPHSCKPTLRNRMQLVGVFGQPDVYLGISCHRFRKLHHSKHGEDFQPEQMRFSPRSNGSPRDCIARHRSKKRCRCWNRRHEFFVSFPMVPLHPQPAAQNRKTPKRIGISSGMGPASMSHKAIMSSCAWRQARAGEGFKTRISERAAAIHKCQARFHAMIVAIPRLTSFELHCWRRVNAFPLISSTRGTGGLVC